MSVIAQSPGTVLKFYPFSSGLDDGFWHRLSKLKLEEYGLDDSFVEVGGFYTNGDAQGLPARLTVDYTVFNSNFAAPPKSFPTKGNLKNFNTIAEYKGSDKLDLLNIQGQQLWNNIVSGEAIKNPALLVKYLLLTFADLKKYHFYYWFSFPALQTIQDVQLSSSVVEIEKKFSSKQIQNLMHSYDSFENLHGQGFFIATLKENDVVTVFPLSQSTELIQAEAKVVFGFCDPCTHSSYPGWPLRNFLVLIAYHWAVSLQEEVTVLCWRDRSREGIRSVSHSLVFTVKLPSMHLASGCPDVVGWERNEKQKLGPRFLDLSASMDPHKLAESAVDLNLKLMRWRLLPELPLEKISATRCLLLGSGTLGCNVGRMLLSWGIRNITLVDNGFVSYSNPVRQSLFVFEDSVGSGKPKAEAAAHMLRKIFPGMNAVGLTLSIPMPGHSVSDKMSAKVKEDVDQLDGLVRNHDVIYLLMDTRESRWLPSVMARSYGKLVINAALGFDTYLVMRHGVPPSAHQLSADPPSADPPTEASHGAADACAQSAVKPEETKTLGCYFCNDVVAPGNSTKDRTLDQQCTVTRPGVSFLASGLAVELMVSTITHPQGIRCPATNDVRSSSEATSPLGLVPHQLRGFLGQFQMLLPTTEAFPQCTACSEKVIEAYRTRGFEFLLQVFNTPNYLEDLTGLTQLHVDTNLDEIWELSDDED